MAASIQKQQHKQQEYHNLNDAFNIYIRSSITPVFISHVVCCWRMG